MFASVADEALKKILERTMGVEKLKKEVEEHLGTQVMWPCCNFAAPFFVHLDVSQATCSKCTSAEEKDKCKRKRVVKECPRQKVEWLRGHGVSLAPLGHQLTYAPVSFLRFCEQLRKSVGVF